MSQSLERVEPPFWWADMKDPSLQLMLYGEGINALEVELVDTEVTVVEVHRPDNPNYLFVDLNIPKSVSASPFEVRLTKGKEVIKKFQYHLKARNGNTQNCQ